VLPRPSDGIQKDVDKNPVKKEIYKDCDIRLFCLFFIREKRTENQIYLGGRGCKFYSLKYHAKFDKKDEKTNMC